MPDGLTIQNLSAWYVPGKPVLDGFSLRLQEHEVLGLMGLNGAGKTTFSRSLCGLHKDYTGGFYWKGIPQSDVNANMKL